jgi:hypothetical protein
MLQLLPQHFNFLLLLAQSIFKLFHLGLAVAEFILNKSDPLLHLVRFLPWIISGHFDFLTFPGQCRHQLDGEQKGASILRLPMLALLLHVLGEMQRKPQVFVEFVDAYDRLPYCCSMSGETLPQAFPQFLQQAAQNF